MAGLCAPLPTLRRHPRECQRTAQGRCGSLLLHRGGLSPPTPCRSARRTESLDFWIRQLPGGLRSFVDARANGKVAPIAVVPPAGSARLPRRAAVSDESRCRSGHDSPHKDIADNKACLVYLECKAPPKEPQGAGLWLPLVRRRGLPSPCATALVSRAATFLRVLHWALLLPRRRDW